MVCFLLQPISITFWTLKIGLKLEIMELFSLQSKHCVARQHGQWKTNGKTAASTDWWFYEGSIFKIELSKYILGSFVIRKWSRQDLWAIFTKFILSFQFSLSYLNSSCFQKIYHILHYTLPHHLLPISNFQIGHKIMLMAKVDLTCTMVALGNLGMSTKLPPSTLFFLTLFAPGAGRICLPLPTLPITVLFALIFYYLTFRGYTIFGKKGIWNFLGNPPPPSGPLEILKMSIFFEGLSSDYFVERSSLV